jgi:hypothetical protein
MPQSGVANPFEIPTGRPVLFKPSYRMTRMGRSDAYPNFGDVKPPGTSKNVWVGSLPFGNTRVVLALGSFAMRCFPPKAAVPKATP